MPDPWTLYWQADRLDSADAVRSADDYRVIRSCWHDFAAELGAGASIVDLATGNGSVPAALLAANDTLKITGIDRADIDPARYLGSPGALAGVDFQGGVDLCELPFADGSFDAATSQFGIEYAALPEALSEAVRVLKPGGHLQFLMHCEDSVIVQPTAGRRDEMAALLADEAVLSRLRDFIAGNISQAELEQAGQEHRDAPGPKTQGITGQIFGGINQVIDLLLDGNRRAAAELCETMRLRLDADRLRLQALEDAALGRRAFDEFLALCGHTGIETSLATQLRGDVDSGTEFVIGWLYRGTRR